MTMTASESGYDRPGHPHRARLRGPAVDETPWGYAIHDRIPRRGLQSRVTAVSRFLGTALLFAAAAMLVVPDYTLNGVAFWLELSILFTAAVLGAVFTRAGQKVVHPELHVDTTRNELRIGRHCLNGSLKMAARLDFGDIHSVYLLRSKDQKRPARLFLRLDAEGNAFEVASGPERELDLLRTRLVQDLAQPIRPRKVIPRHPRH